MIREKIKASSKENLLYLTNLIKHYSLPNNIDEHRIYKKNVITFLEARNKKHLIHLF